MTAPVQDSPDILDLLAAEPSPSKAEHRAAICRAIKAAARENAGQVTAATIRPHLPEWVDEHRIGAVVCALVKSGALRRTTATAESGNAKNRNRFRPMPVYRIHRIEEVA